MLLLRLQFFGFSSTEVEVNQSDYCCLQISSASEEGLLILHTGAHADSISFFPICLQVLHEEWARYSAFYKYQPIDLVR